VSDLKKGVRLEKLLYQEGRRIKNIKKINPGPLKIVSGIVKKRNVIRRQMKITIENSPSPYSTHPSIFMELKVKSKHFKF